MSPAAILTLLGIALVLVSLTALLGAWGLLLGLGITAYLMGDALTPEE